MATIITNRATVNYNFGSSSAVVFSNLTSTVLNGALSIEKSSLSDSFRVGQELTYIITLRNNSSTATQRISATDNLGTFIENGNSITPLTYIGTAQLFINGVFSSDLTAVVGNRSILFEIAGIPAGETAQIIYRARVNEYACSNEGSTITNTVCAEYLCNCPCEGPVCDSFSLTVDEYAELRVVKSVCPNQVVCGEPLNYVIDIYNYGNIDATGVVLTDIFEPALRDLSVNIDGVIIPESEYSYVNGVLTLPNGSGNEISVPSAICERNAQTGEVAVTPGVITVTVSGTI